MRDDRSDPAPRGNILVAGTNPGSARTARPPAIAASTTEGGQVAPVSYDSASATGEVLASSSAESSASEATLASRIAESPATETAPASPAVAPASGAEAPPADAAPADAPPADVAPADAPPADVAPADAPPEGTPTSPPAEAVRPEQAKPAEDIASPSAEVTRSDLMDRELIPSELVRPGSVSPATKDPRWPVAAPPEPSWAKVLGTTISLWTSRRLGRLTGRGRGSGQALPAGETRAIAASARRSGIRWPLVVFVLVLVILALAGLQLSGALGQPSKSQSVTGSRAGNGSSGSNADNGALSAAQATRSHAGTWIAQQVSSSDLIACDPLMCTTLQSDGVAASRLMTIQPTAIDPLGADVVVATSSVRSQFGRQLVSEYAPELIATFGTGASRVDVRAVANFGAAAFGTSERADLAARKTAGAQLLRNGFHVGDQGAGEIRAGQVDSRLLVTMAALLSQRAVDVSSFGDTGPGAPVLYRQVTIVDAPGQTGTAALAADLSQVQQQRGSFLPAHASIVHLANGQSALRIEYGAPDQPGLLSGGNS